MIGKNNYGNYPLNDYIAIALKRRCTEGNYKILPPNNPFQVNKCFWFFQDRLFLLYHLLLQPERDKALHFNQHKN